MPGEAEPVTAARQLADVADRAAADLPGQLEDLGHRQHWPLVCLFGARAANPARVAREDLVIFDCCRENRTEQAVRLCRDRHRRAVGEEFRAPFPDHLG
jgi:hypothetical protein